jgi:hypothetical protein
MGVMHDENKNVEESKVAAGEEKPNGRWASEETGEGADRVREQIGLSFATGKARTKMFLVSQVASPPK